MGGCSFVTCFDENGVHVSYDQPLNKYSQLTLKDSTQSYVYIGSEVYSFDIDEVVTSYFSMMGNNRWPYPVALTPSSAIYMLDEVKVPRQELAPFITKES